MHPYDTAALFTIAKIWKQPKHAHDGRVDKETVYHTQWDTIQSYRSWKYCCLTQHVQTKGYHAR